MVITINISEEQIKRAEQLATHERMTTGKAASRSSEIGRAIDERFAALFLTERPVGRTNDVQTEKAA